MARILEHASRDVDDQAQSLQGWHQHYEQLGCGRFHGSAWQLVMGEGALLRERTNRQLREQIKPPTDHVVLAIPLAMGQGTMLDGRLVQEQTLILMSGQRHYELMAAGPMEFIGVSVHRHALERHLDPAMLQWLLEATEELAVCEEATRSLVDLSAPACESALLSATLTQTLTLAMDDAPAQPASTVPRRADSRQRVVHRAIEFMRAHLHDDIGIPEICAAAFTCRRSLQYCFEEFLHTSPQAYLRALRLNEARRLLKCRTEQPIIDIAGALGFCSSSHFTRHYRLMFEELPSETLKLACYGPHAQF